MALFSAGRGIKSNVLSLAIALAVPLAGALLTDAPLIWPLSTLAYSIGLLALFSAGDPNAFKLISYNLIAAALYLLDAAFFASYYIQNQGFNVAFFYHLRTDLLYSGLRSFLPLIVALSMALVVYLVVSTLALRQPSARRPRRLAPLLVVLAVGGISLSPPARGVFTFALAHAGTPEEDTLYKNFPELRRKKVAATFHGSKRPNVILIYAESFEQRYFDPVVFPGLAPHLETLRKESMDFANVSQGVGAEWTMGGLVASQCGYPLAGAYDVKGNDMGMLDEFMPRTTTLGDILKEDGYHLAFIGGADYRFAGKDDFLRSHGYTELHDYRDLSWTLRDKSYLNEWGLYDDSMLDYAFERFRQLSAAKWPFVLTLLTLETHPPAGFVSARSRGNLYGDGANPSLNAVHSSDSLLSEFINRVRTSPYSKDTVIVVLSDHLAMRNASSDQLARSRQPPRLTFFINTPEGRRFRNEQPGLHYDIAPTILDVLGYELEGHLGFGAPLTRGPGYLYTKFPDGRWRDHSEELMAISRTMWSNDAVLSTGIRFDALTLSVHFGGKTFKLHECEAYSDDPDEALFVFDEHTFALDEALRYPTQRSTQGTELLQDAMANKNKLIFAIGLAKHMQGFTAPGTDPQQWVYFFGKPGSVSDCYGKVTGSFKIPYDLLRKYSGAAIDETVLRQREAILNQASKTQSGRSGGGQLD